MEVVPRVHKVDGTWGGNVYVLEDDDGLALVDGALPGNAGRILRYIEGIGRDPSELRLIVLTHAHPDHTGTIPALLKHANMRVLVHSGDVKWESPSPPWLSYPGQLVSLPGKVPFVRKIFADEIVADGYNIPVMGGLRVLHTPGHTPGSICLHLEEQGVLFTGDILISDGKRFTRPIPFPGFDTKSYRESLERLSELEFDVACVGHGRPLVGGAPAKVSEMLENYFWAAPWWKLVRKLPYTHLP